MRRDTGIVRWRWALLLGILMAVAFAGRGVIGKMATDAMLFHPSHGQDRTPKALGLAYEEVWLTAEDGVCTQAWWIPASRPAPVVLHFHGNGGNLSNYLGLYREIWSLDVSVLAAEYRGYGDSEGSPSERGLFADARVALAEARRRADGQPVIVWGWSLGGAVAIELAASEETDGLIAESTFTSLADMSDRSGIPFARLFVAYELDSLKKMSRVEEPVFILHGDRDRVVPYEMSERLHAAAGSAVWKRHRRVPGGQHDAHRAGGAPLWEELRSFVHRNIPAQQR